MKTYDNFIEYVAINKTDDLRCGQNLMMCIMEKYPSLYNDIKCTDLDCFYNENKVCHTLNWLEIRLTKEDEK